MKKITLKTLIALALFFCSLSNSVAAEKQISLKTFFPHYSGTVGSPTVLLPQSFVLDDSGANTTVGFLWGTPEDLSRANDISKVKTGIFRARYSRNVGVGQNGVLTVDRNELERSGLALDYFRSGFLTTNKEAFTLWFKGNLNGQLVYMLYVYSPADRLAILINLQGAKTKTSSDALWENFISSLMGS